MAHIQRVPWLGSAEPDVLFVGWRVAEGARVARGETIATVETLKAAFDVEAERDGVLLGCFVAAGDRVPALAPIAAIGELGEAVPEPSRPEPAEGARGPLAPGIARHGSPGPLAAAPEPPRMAGVRDVAERPAAPAARRRAAELGIGLMEVVGTGPDGLVRLDDVERTHAERGAPAPGLLDPEFLRLVRADADAFARLSPDLKVELYKRAGAAIGPDCRIGPGTVLLVGRLVLGAGAVLGPDGHFEASELVAGELLHFGSRCRVRCTRLRLGANAFFADDVEVGGGGALDPEAELVVGSHGFVGEHAHLNPCRPIRIGDEVVIARSAVIMTHSFGGSWLRGYPSRFAGVTIGDGAQIGIGAVLFPGAEVGAGAVLLSGSSLVSALAPGRLGGGVPAGDLKAAAESLGPAELEARARALVGELARQLALRGHDAATTEEGGELRVAVAHADGTHLLRFRPAAGFDPVDGVEDVRAALAWPPAEWAGTATDVFTIDLAGHRSSGAPGPLGAAFRELLRKRGVRLEPRAWAYRGGWL